MAWIKGIVMAGIITVLACAGIFELLERRQDEEDRRAVRIRLSESGRRLIRELEQRFSHMTGRFLARHPAEENAHLIELLDQFNCELQTN